MEGEKENTDGNAAAMVHSFCEITSSSKEEALFFLESHNFDLDAAVSTFFDNAHNPIIIPQNDDVVPNPNPNAAVTSPPSDSHSPDFYPSRSPSHSPTPSPSRAPYELRSRRSLGKKPSSSRQDFQPDEYYTGGENSGMLVRDPSKGNNSVDEIFEHAREVAVDPPPENPRNSSSFSGAARLLSGETVPYVSQRLEEVVHTVTFWRNGFSVNDGPLRSLDDPQNAPFLESIKKSVCPKELEPADRRTAVHVNLTRRDEDYPEPVKPRHLPFQGVGRTLGGPSSSSDEATQTTGASLTTAPLPTLGLVVDESQPVTSIQLRLADGTRMVSRFNHHHTIRDVRAFIDASRPGGVRNYQLQAMGFPPKQLIDWDQSIEQAGIANSVVIQKL
ncbi:plant UBX domain-containing protein 4 isoform X2 [Vigna angularis]|uniref:plant UBX domain-containing protein 4 isoform X2 n=1 Tax=Phaseolus angularis TaxID=3914 RepID=UPI000809F1CF|nr:plant UBX domain-containing protein 4 isoform X2 [Vigna angularis]